MFTAEQKTELAKPLQSGNVKSRQQAGRKLSYVEGWVAIAEANRIFGFDSWTRETIEMRLVSERERKIGQQQKDGWSVSYIAKVKVIAFAGDTLVIREGFGAGHGIDADLGLAHESAAKEAETDAMKRALMTFGNPFGLALYDKEQTQVENGNTNGHNKPVAPNSAALADELIGALKERKTREAVKSWRGDPATQGKIDVLTDGDYDRVRLTLQAHVKSLPAEPVNPIGAG